jgi:hypothetical protein
MNVNKSFLNLATGQYDMIYTPGTNNTISYPSTTVNSAYSPKSLYKSGSTFPSDNYRNTSYTINQINTNFSMAFWFKSNDATDGYNYAGTLLGGTGFAGGVYVTNVNRYGIGSDINCIYTSISGLTNFNHFG